MIDRDAIIQACGGDLHHAARLIQYEQERHWRQVQRLNQPWPEEESATLQDRVEHLEVGQRELEAELKGKKVIVRPLMPIRLEPVMSTAKGCVPL